METVTGRKDFFISYTSKDRQWAEWIAWQLEAAGYKTIVQAWDFHAGSNFVLDMHEAARQATRTIAVLSPDYLASKFTPAEWVAAFRRDPKGEDSTLIPVQVRSCDVEGLLGQIISIDLVGQDEATAKQILLEHISRQRRKPVRAPAFPSVPVPSFPGAFSLHHPPLSDIQRTNRTRLLKQVRTTWIAGLLERSLHQAAWIDLHLQEQPDALDNPGHLETQETNRSPRPLPAGTTIV